MIPRFRAWNKATKEMYGADDIIAINFEEKEICVQTIYFEQGLPDSRDLDYYDFDDIVLMQSTGLRDKNDKKIFDGDIVDYKGRKAVIKWHGSYASFIYMFVDELRSRNQEWNPLYLSYFHFQVVGNKFETPALLEVSS